MPGQCARAHWFWRQDKKASMLATAESQDPQIYLILIAITLKYLLLFTSGSSPSGYGSAEPLPPVTCGFYQWQGWNQQD